MSAPTNSSFEICFANDEENRISEESEEDDDDEGAKESSQEEEESKPGHLISNEYSDSIVFQDEPSVEESQKEDSGVPEEEEIGKDESKMGLKKKNRRTLSLQLNLDQLKLQGQRRRVQSLGPTTSLDVSSSSEDEEEKNKKEEKKISPFPLVVPPRTYLYIQMELCQKKSLRDWLYDSEGRKPDKILSFFNDIIAAVEYVHDQSLMHRDLKVRYFMIFDLSY